MPRSQSKLFLGTRGNGGRRYYGRKLGEDGLVIDLLASRAESIVWCPLTAPSFNQNLTKDFDVVSFCDTLRLYSVFFSVVVPSLTSFFRLLSRSLRHKVSSRLFKMFSTNRLRLWTWSWNDNVNKHNTKFSHNKKKHKPNRLFISASSSDKDVSRSRNVTIHRVYHRVEQSRVQKL